jgi:hypothetical protein
VIARDRKTLGLLAAGRLARVNFKAISNEKKLQAGNTKPTTTPTPQQQNQVYVAAPEFIVPIEISLARSLSLRSRLPEGPRLASKALDADTPMPARQFAQA